MCLVIKTSHSLQKKKKKNFSYIYKETLKNKSGFQASSCNDISSRNKVFRIKLSPKIKNITFHTISIFKLG